MPVTVEVPESSAHSATRLAKVPDVRIGTAPAFRRRRPTTSGVIAHILRSVFKLLRLEVGDDPAR